MTTVVLLSHGSPDPRSGDAARLLARRVSAATGDPVVAAFLQHDAPDLATQCRVLADAGVAEAVVVPMLITPAFHARVDVPSAVHDAQARSGLRLVVSDPIGTDDALLDAIDRELPPGPVVLAAAGTSDPAARDRLRRLAIRWSGRRGSEVAVGYASQAAPDAASAITDLEARSGTRVGVASFVLYPGVLPDRIAAAAGGRLLSTPLAEAPEVFDLIQERVQRAVSVVTDPTRITPTLERTSA